MSLDSASLLEVSTSMGALIEGSIAPILTARAAARAALMAIMFLDGPEKACDYAYQLADEMALAVPTSNF